jgi:glycine/D-amino acid oxidase-like deaminating enzyme
MADTDVLIIGAGLAGLTCARRLQKSKLNFTILEASDGVGGRVRTDLVEGFRLDRGFQVFLTAYPEAQRWLDYPSLELRPFYSGSRVGFNGRFHHMADPFRHPVDALGTLFNPIGHLVDKMLVASIRRRACAGRVEEVFNRAEEPTLSYLQQAGLSRDMIDRFFRPFAGGIFLDRDLRTSSRAFEFVFRMFAEGEAAIPARGMGEISESLAAKLPGGSVRLNSRIAKIRGQRALGLDGQEYEARAIVVATEGPAAVTLLGLERPTGSRAVQCYYYTGPAGRVGRPILHLDGTGDSPFNSVVFLNDVVPDCAPRGQLLVSATALGVNPVNDADARRQFTAWFGEEASQWRLLKHYTIRHAQPDLTQVHLPERQRPARIRQGLYACGDYRFTASINGAMESGRLAAEAVIDDLARR